VQQAKRNQLVNQQLMLATSGRMVWAMILVRNIGVT